MPRSVSPIGASSVYPSLFLGRAHRRRAVLAPVDPHAQAQGRRIRHRHVGRVGTGPSPGQSRHAGARRNRHVADRAQRLCDRKPPGAHLLVRARRDGRPAGDRLRPAAQPARRGDPGDPRQRGGGGIDRRAGHERQAARVHARRLRRGAGGGALGGDGAHLPAEGLFQPAVDGVHDLHGAGWRIGDLRGSDSRRGHLLRHRDLVRRHGRLVSGRPRRDGAHFRASLPARHLGLGRGPHVAEAPAGRLPPALREPGRNADSKTIGADQDEAGG